MTHFDLNPDAGLVPYAALEATGFGRVHAEEKHPYRGEFQRDRDRILHTSAFRKLEYKTQVFVYHEGDYYRTRLTHSLEVAQITRSICKSLQLNEDLAEAIALAHDLGHPPFGHTGQDVLNELMREVNAEIKKCNDERVMYYYAIVCLICDYFRNQ